MIKEFLRGLGTLILEIVGLIIVSLIGWYLIFVVSKETVDMLTAPIIIFAIVVIGFMVYLGIMSKKRGKHVGFIKKFLDWDRKLEEKSKSHR